MLDFVIKVDVLEKKFCKKTQYSHRCITPSFFSTPFFYEALSPLLTLDLTPVEAKIPPLINPGTERNRSFKFRARNNETVLVLRDGVTLISAPSPLGYRLPPTPGAPDPYRVPTLAPLRPGVASATFRPGAPASHHQCPCGDDGQLRGRCRLVKLLAEEKTPLPIRMLLNGLCGLPCK